MTPAEVREVVLLATLFVVAIMLTVTVLRPRRSALSVAPFGEQLSDVRHRMANVEQQVRILPGHEIRLRAVELEVGAVRADLAAIKSGQARNERMLEMLVAHQIGSERQEAT